MSTNQFSGLKATIRQTRISEGLKIQRSLDALRTCYEECVREALEEIESSGNKDAGRKFVSSLIEESRKYFETSEEFSKSLKSQVVAMYPEMDRFF